jgi:hypothetical protein
LSFLRGEGCDDQGVCCQYEVGAQQPGPNP